MSELIELINADWKMILTGIILFVAGVICATKAFDFIVGRFGIKTKKMLEEEAHKKELADFRNELIDIQTQRKLDKETSDKNDEDIKQSIKELADSIKVISDDLQIMKDKNDSSRRADLKDRIGQSYRYYHENKCWNHMEKEAFEDLIKSYEEAGGKNSFVHSICEPESQTWKVVD